MNEKILFDGVDDYERSDFTVVERRKITYPKKEPQPIAHCDFTKGKGNIIPNLAMEENNYKSQILKYSSIYLCVDKDGTEHMYQTDWVKNIIRTETKEWELSQPDIGSHIILPPGTIKILIGSEMTWDCEPLEYEPKKNEEIKEEPVEEFYYWYILILQKDGGYRCILQETNENRPHFINALMIYPGIVINQIQITKKEYEYLKDNIL